MALDPRRRLAAQTTKIKNAFNLFAQDRGNEHVLPIEDVGSTIRFLELWPTAAELLNIILPAMCKIENGDDADSAVESISYATFETWALQALALRPNPYEPNSEETLIQAFKVFDPDDTGMIDADQLIELLRTFEDDPMTEKELDAFLAVARDDETNKIFYEDYVAYLTGQRALTKL